MNIFAKIGDNVWYGLMLGLLVPGVLACGVWYIRSVSTALANADLLYIGCIAVNLFFLTKLLDLRRSRAANGVLAATFICAFVFYFYKVLQ